ncbi:MAG: tRNA modification GTPase [Phycisphaerae bacterium]|nr:tRNA modification GTPase [Phycisphaerae bacterium]
MLDRPNDTIVAVSSPPGVSVRGVVRLSGPEAIALANTLFEGDRGERLLQVAGHHRLEGHIGLDRAARLPAEAYVFRAPASYTRQDIVELHTVGSPPVLAAVCDRFVTLGARYAEPGEFTARAYFNGAMDLTRIEGVAAMIHARTDSQLRASEALLHGELSRRSAAMRERLTDLLALIEARIDFADAPIEFISDPEVLAVLDQTIADLARLLRESPSIERLGILPEILILGRPNAGKSTLFNRLTGMDRAIQSAVAGTTRDVIAAPMPLGDVEVMLIDSAGWSEDLKEDMLEDHPDVLAQGATQRALSSADMILLVVDAMAPFDPVNSLLLARMARRPVCIVASKIDLTTDGHPPPWVSLVPPGRPVITVSAHTGQGLEALRQEIHRLVFADVEPHGTELLALSSRQRLALSDAGEALARARAICGPHNAPCDDAELLALEVREAVSALSLLTGELVTEELLGRIFARFCIGK